MKFSQDIWNNPLVRLLRVLGFIGTISLLCGIIAFTAMWHHFDNDLPELKQAQDYRPPLSSRIYSVDGRLIGEFGTEKRRVVPYAQIPKQLIQALIATEDKKFFEHGGIDYVGNIRAIIYRLIGKSDRIGGTSTITQQVARSLLVSQLGFKEATKRSIFRKLKEAIIAKKLEQNLTKEEIIWIYLNHANLGHGAYGIASAAENYFRKDVTELNLAEVSLIAGLPQAPSRYSPFINPKLARTRQQTVLSRMVRNGFISEADKKAALQKSVEQTVHARDNRFLETAPYFTEHVRRYLYDTYGEDMLYRGGLEVHTTLDLERQAYAEDALIDGIRWTDKRQGYFGPIARLNQASHQSMFLKWLKEQQGEKQITLDTPLLALVAQVDDKTSGGATIDIGHKQKYQLSMAGMRWARAPDPEAYIEGARPQKPSDVIQVGDVILVTPIERSLLKDLAHGPKYVKSIPKKIDQDDRDQQIYFMLDQVPNVQGALIAMNPENGYVEAMIGGYAFEESEFNRAFQACRQPGSSFKPIVYSAAISLKEYTPATMILDTPITVRDTDIGQSWKPENFAGGYLGQVPARVALMNSMNVPALKTMEDVGIENVVNFAHHMGIHTELKEEMGTAIGSSCVTPWELTHVYTTWARGGLRPEPRFIKSIRDRDGHTLETYGSPKDYWQSRPDRIRSQYRDLLKPPHRVLAPEDAYVINYMLKQVATHGTAAKASSLGFPVAGKTGTTNNSFDTWFVGFSPEVVTSVWLGYDTRDMPLHKREQGGRTALPVWMDFMRESHKGLKVKRFKRPENICEARIDSETGERLNEPRAGSFVAPFKCGSEPELGTAATETQEDDLIQNIL